MKHKQRGGRPMQAPDYNMTSQALAPQLQNGVVSGRTDELFHVQTASGHIRSRQAVSCLVRPEKDDMVLLSHSDEGSFILAVLQRPSAAPLGLELQGDVRLHVEQGDLSISASRDLELCAGEQACMAAEKVALQAASASIGVERTRFLGKALDIKVGCVNRVVDTMNDVCRRLTRRLVHSLRYVQEREEVQAGDMRYLVQETCSVNAKNTVILSEEVAKIDAGQVHLG